jgi:Uncharacterized protein conserved in cyanobacteria
MTTPATSWESLAPPVKTEVVYPESDGNPIADNTLQFEWIVTIKENLDALFSEREDVFVAGDLLWYPVEGDNRTRIAPDALVAFGRPKGYRGSYKQWEEGGIAPQVVFEILSPGNRAGEMTNKYLFYDRFGVEEYYLYDPDSGAFSAWIRRESAGRLEPIDLSPAEWTSPRLGVRFSLTPSGLVLSGPDGERFRTFGEVAAEREQERRAREQAERARQQAEQARQQAEQERDAAQARAERLAARLRELGGDPDAA